MPLPLDVQSEKREAQEAIALKHTEYLQKHPEIQRILNDFVSAALVEQPADVFDFARNHFSSTKGDAPAP